MNYEVCPSKQLPREEITEGDYAPQKNYPGFLIGRDSELKEN